MIGRTLLIAATSIVFCAASASRQSTLPSLAPDSSFRALFNGRDLNGWHGRGHVDPRSIFALDAAARARAREQSLPEFQRHWRVDHGELVNDGEGPYATTDEEFGDIELRLEYRTVAKADSGIYLRGNPQVQIWDTTEAGGKWDRGAQFGSGGLFNNAPGAPGRDPLVKADKPFGQWNRLRIIQVGERTWVWLNGQRVVDGARMENFWDRTLPLWRRGPIQLQTHGGEIRWRDIRIREIASTEATAILAAREPAGYERVFNGRDWTGWLGPTDQYSIVDGSIVCKPDSGGTIYTAREYADFSVRLEFKLPVGGNNGLAVRYPGEGDTAYVGMCELQVLDNDSPKYATLDPRQYHGSAYGMVAAKRDFLRPVGEWNYEQVTVKGSTIKVELNGTTILDADLSTVTEFLDDKAHPGKDRKTGHFGFAGHNDPVEFRRVRIREL
jgi:3-keto-disaccharide hydrolase